MSETFDPGSRPLPALVALAFERLSDDMVRHVHAAGYADLQLHHLLNVFRFLGPGGDRPAELARRAGVTPQAMSQLLADLQARGYVRRRPDPTDGRATLITWDERGVGAATVTEEWFRRTEAAWAQRLGQGPVEATRRLLTLVVLGEEQAR